MMLKSLLTFIGAFSAVCALSWSGPALAADDTQASSEKPCPWNFDTLMSLASRQMLDRHQAVQADSESVDIPPMSEDPILERFEMLIERCSDKPTIFTEMPLALAAFSDFHPSLEERVYLAELSLSVIPDEAQFTAGFSPYSTFESFIIPTYFELALRTGQSTDAFMLKDAERCPYTSQGAIDAELLAHVKIQHAFLNDPQFSEIAVPHVPLEFRLNNLREVCPDYARLINARWATLFGLTAERAYHNPDLPFEDGTAAPDTMAQDMAKAGLKLLDEIERLRLAPPDQAMATAALLSGETAKPSPGREVEIEAELRPLLDVIARGTAAPQ